MKQKLKYLATILSVVGILSPLVKIKISNYNFYLGLLNIGFKPMLVVLLLSILFLHPLYLPNKFYNKLSILINSISFILVSIMLYYIYSEISKLKNGFNFKFISSFSELNISLFFIGWILIYSGIILSIILSIDFPKKDNLIEEK